jgi:hypothetical protein
MINLQNYKLQFQVNKILNIFLGYDLKITYSILKLIKPTYKDLKKDKGDYWYSIINLISNSI